jgi:DNA-binding MarR family transcriptional regulator
MNTGAEAHDVDAEEGRESPAQAGIIAAILNAVEESSVVTQRSLSRQLGIALGLTNAYLRRCVSKGLVKVSQIPTNRYRYYLTPKGFSEKSRLTARYLTYSFNFVRQARAEYDELLQLCETRKWRRVVLCGTSELAEIAVVCADSRNISLVGLIDETATVAKWGRLPVARDISTFGTVDAVILTSYAAPQTLFDTIVRQFPEEHTLAPRFLNISRKRPQQVADGEAVGGEIVEDRAVARPID